MSKTIIYVIADYGALHDLAFAEVAEKLYFELQDLNIDMKLFAVPAFDTYATGFMLAQTAINSELGENHKFYVNTAPRKDDLTPRVSNSGEGLCYTKLNNGVEVVAVNSGYSMSYLKDSTDSIQEIHCEKKGSQFRSRDIFPQSFSKIMHGDYSELGDNIIEHVPDFREDVVAYTDGYGNMKCSIDPKRVDEFLGSDVSLTVNGRQQVARAAEGIFGVADGQYCFSRGSSGWEKKDGTRREFTEIIKRGGNAGKTFGKPPGGIPVEWKVVK